MHALCQLLKRWSALLLISLLLTIGFGLVAFFFLLPSPSPCQVYFQRTQNYAACFLKTAISGSLWLNRGVIGRPLSLTYCSIVLNSNSQLRREFRRAKDKEELIQYISPFKRTLLSQTWPGSPATVSRHVKSSSNISPYFAPTDNCSRGFQNLTFCQ